MLRFGGRCCGIAEATGPWLDADGTYPSPKTPAGPEPWPVRLSLCCRFAKLILSISKEENSISIYFFITRKDWIALLCRSRRVIFINGLSSPRAELGCTMKKSQKQRQRLKASSSQKKKKRLKASWQLCFLMPFMDQSSMNLKERIVCFEEKL